MHSDHHFDEFFQTHTTILAPKCAQSLLAKSWREGFLTRWLARRLELGALSWGVANDQCAVKMAMAIGNQANIPSFVPLHISEHMDRNEIRTVPNVPTS